ncbi:MAG: hypothetical protein M0T70_03085 [Geobacteraceae bacterium]|nr:hypothetical protein [Geobacteraceae bacterium]
MDAKQFTREELEKMFSDYLAGADSILKGELLSENEKALRRNTLDISKQLLVVLKVNAEIKPGFVSAEELEVMINDYESFWDSYNNSRSFSDIQNELAGKLTNNIFWITKQLVGMM